MDQQILVHGRAPESIGFLPQPEPVSAIRMSIDLTAAVDAWASENDMSRSEAIRRLVDIGLKAK